MQMYNAEYLQEKWAPILDYQGMDPIKDSHRRSVTAILLENQERELREERSFLYEASPTNSAGTGGFSGSATAGGPVAGFDPILISLVRRSLPNLIAYDIAGVQPMTGPTGLIFAMRTKYSTQGGTEAFYDEANVSFAGTASNNGGSGFGLTLQSATDTTGNVFANTVHASRDTSTTTGRAEALGDTNAANTFQEMAFSIEKVTVTARTRALKAEYSMELAQDLKAVHGLDAETELANILSSEILAEINVKLFVQSTRQLKLVAKLVLQQLVLSTSTQILMVVGWLKKLKVLLSRSSVKLTLSPRQLVEAKATS